MRCGFLLVMLAWLLGAAPALAQQDIAARAPYPETPAVQHKTKHAASKAAEVKHRAVKPAAKKTAASSVPLPPAAPRASMAKATPAKINTAKIQPAKTTTTKADTIKPNAATASGASAGLSPAERLKIQQELFWSGDYVSASGGNSMEAAIRKFQKRSRAKVTGALTDAQRADLIAAANLHAQEFGWRVVVDPATGIRIGLPTKLVPDVHDAAHGTRWSSAHGEVQVETFRFKNANLAALFDEEKKHPADRKAERSVLNSDNFFISGMQGLKYFSVRATARDGEVRGFTLLYDQMMEGIVAPVMVAMASAFSPFPEHLAPFAALDNKVEYGTGLIVSADGHIVTARKVAQDCQVIVADGLGNAERVAEDTDHGLALLRVYGAGKLPALALPRAAAGNGDITLIGIPDPKEQDGSKKLTSVKAQLADGDAIQLDRPVPMAGFSGAAALGAQGRFLGMMETGNYVLASADASVPPVRLITASAIRDFLERNHVAVDGTDGDARAAAIRIICVRK